MTAALRGRFADLVLYRRAGPTRYDLHAMADLGCRVVAADGGRLTLEHAALRSRSGEQVEDVLWRRGDHVLGCCGTYAFGGDIEVAGMADPDTRRRGTDTHLVTATLMMCAERGHARILFDVARTGAGGEVLPRRRDSGVPDLAPVGSHGW